MAPARVAGFIRQLLPQPRAAASSLPTACTPRAEACWTRPPASPPQSMVKSFEVTDLPVRTAKFVPRKQWVVCGADDMFVRVYNYNTMDKVKQFEAHTDYIR